MPPVPGSPSPANLPPSDSTEQVFSLGGAQSRLWAGQELAGEAPLYRMALAFRIRGPLDIALFRRAFAQLVQEHGALRLAIGEDALGRTVSFPGAYEAPLEILEPDISQTDEEGSGDPEAWVQDWCAERVQRPFRRDDPLVDACLVALGPEDHLWYFAQHHVVADAWSTSLAFHRMSALYSALDRNEELPAPPAREYADYLAFERKASQTDSFQRARTHWEDLARDFGHGPAGLYGHRPPAKTAASDGLPARSTRTERVPLRLGARRSKAIRDLSQTSKFRGLTDDLSRFHVFAVALFALLRRTGEESPGLSLLIPVHNRSSRAFRETLGVFIEVLPLTVTTQRSDSFLDLASRVQTSMRSLVGHALPGITGSAPPLPSAEVVLNYIPSSFEGGFAGRAVETEWLHPGHGDPQHALRLQVHDFDESGEFVLHFDAHCDVFSPAERQAIGRDFVTLLDALLEDPSAAVDDVALLGPDELVSRSALLDRAAHAAPSPSVLDLFAEQVRARPEAACIRVSSDSLGDYLTYREVDDLAARFRGALAARGVERGDLVALGLPRSPDLIALMLATLQRGAAYLPLDTKLPPARLQQTLALSKPRVAVFDSEERLAQASGGTAPHPAGVTISELLDLSASAGKVAGESAETGPVETAPADRAYVIFTSGSTGTPKGVEIPHGALSNYARFAVDQYTGGEPKTFAFFSPAAVDLSVTSIFTPLTSGGTALIYPESTDPRDLTVLDVIDDNRCEVIKLTPAHLALLVGRGPIAAPKLETLVIGGEDLKRTLARRVQDELGTKVALFNEYGPTEATVGCMIHRFGLEDTAHESVPIGLPINGVRLHVVNSADQPVPDGVAGELLIGGAGLASGYLGNPEETARRFAPDPVLRGEHRVYRTGDMARISPETGQLTFLGRRDDQVKIRGVRIELGEIEAALEALPEVSDSVVVAAAAPAEGPDRAHLGLDGDPRWVDVTHCVRCGLASNHPEARLEESAEGVCAVCLEFESYRDVASGYFGTEAELRERLDRGRERARQNGSEFDCIALLSGGKDSTYALYQLVELGYRPLVFSLDNGYIADGAKANIQRVVDHLGLELAFVSTASASSMNAIFADSLDRFSNVCQGCFKTIYTLATNLARERGIQTIVTGLSRGQIFETRLAPIFRSGVLEPEEVERFVIDARKTYHRVDDAVARHLDVSAFAGDEVFDEIEFVDFYRYWDVPLSEVLQFIADNAAWRRPADTGRSTNCLINDVGIAVHKHERGFHNYALPYSWDVRLGHKTREECLDELDDEIDDERVQRILHEVGADRSGAALTDERRLIAYYVPARLAEDETSLGDAASIRAALAQSLPESMLPQAFVPLPSLPMTAAGKINRAKLPAPETDVSRAGEEAPHVAPRTELEEKLAEIWSGVLHVEGIGIHDHFLDLGGDSILGIQMVARARAAGWAIAPRDVFTHPTIGELAQVARPVPRADSSPEPGQAAHGASDQPLGETPITPMQAYGLRAVSNDPAVFGMSVQLEAVGAEALDEPALREALGAVTAHHDALRTRFAPASGGESYGWVQEVLHPNAAAEPWLEVHAPPAGHESIEALEDELHRHFDLDAGRLLAASIVRVTGQPDRLIIAVHHLVMDAVSWEPLLTDLDAAYDAARRGATSALPGKTASWRSWARFLRDSARSGAFDPLASRWSLEPAGAASHRPHGFVGDEVAVRRTLSPEASAQAKKLGPADALLAALAFALQRTEGHAAVTIDIESYGRAQLPIHERAPDVSRTLGWFTALSPIVIPPVHSAREAMDLARQQRRAFDDAEASFGFLFPQAHGGSDVLFNYLGTQGAPVEIVSASGSPRLRAVTGVRLVRPPKAQRTHRLDVSGVEDADGSLAVTALFSPSFDTAEAVAALLSKMEEAILGMEPGPAPDGGGTSLSSSLQTGLDLSEEDMDDLLADYG